jgi:hypothetical protein
MKMRNGMRVRIRSLGLRRLGVPVILAAILLSAGCGVEDAGESIYCPEVCGQYPSASTAHDVVAADFDEDGHLDLAVIGHLPVDPLKGLVILKGNGRGTFTLMKNLAVGDHNHGVIAVDVNLDGHLDVVTTTAGRWFPKYEMHVVHIHFGDGAGDFYRHDILKIEEILTGLLDGRAGDLNGDGFVDLVLTGVPGSQAVVLFGKENGEFELPGVPVGRRLHTRMSVIADFDSDGAQDIAVTNSGKTISVFLGDGAGGFISARDFQAGSFGPRSIRKADLDNDGNLDVAVTTRLGNGISFIRGDGNGSFFEPIHKETGEDPRALRIGYLNGDDFLDAVVANSLSQTVSFLYGDGTGDFPTMEHVLVGDAPIIKRSDKIPVFPGLKKPGTGDGIVGLEIADVKEDGRADVIASSTYDAQVFILWSGCSSDAQP